MRHAVRTIALREIRDTVSDWRMLVPIAILALVFPSVIVVGANTMIRFLDDENVLRAIVPFSMLLIGFIPASFSLITALESFVGERERNSLEALLAMPITDGELYLGKFLSSLVPPLGSALLAMSVFAVELAFFQPDLFLIGLHGEYIVTILMLIAAKALLMVAGAVIISSHTSSIRAANLLASFILLPTAALIQVEALYVIAGLWGQLRWFAMILFAIAAVLMRTGLGTFNREEILSREHDQVNLQRIWATFRTYLRQYQPLDVPAEQYPAERFSLGRFYRHELLLLLREYRLPLGMALLAALVGGGAGAWVGQNYQIPLLNTLLDDQLGRSAGSGLGFALGIFLNNMRVALLSGILSSVTFGLFSFLVPLVAFGQVALIASIIAERGGGRGPWVFLAAYVLPHGWLELPTALLGAALGIRLGVTLLTSRPGITVGQNLLWSLAQFFKLWALVLAPLFFVSALIEGFLTPAMIAALYR